MSRETETDQQDEKDLAQPEAADESTAEVETEAEKEAVSEEAEQELLEEEPLSEAGQIEQLEQQVAEANDNVLRSPGRNAEPASSLGEGCGERP